MNGFREITVRLPPQLLKIVSESKNKNRNDNRCNRVIGGLRNNAVAKKNKQRQSKLKEKNCGKKDQLNKPSVSDKHIYERAR